MPPLNHDPTTPLDLDEVRRRLHDRNGQDYWRSLEELAETEQFQELLHREFPVDASVWTNAISRRRFLMLMGASLALAGVTGCGTRAPAEKIVPYVKEPEGLVPGKPLFFATAIPLAGTAIGLLVESHEGRPTKVEGNPDHPASLGATDSFAQASVLNLYDPDRAQTINYLGQVRTWDEALDTLRNELTELKRKNEKENKKPGEGLYFLTGAVSSPTLADQLKKIVGSETFEGLRWHEHEPAAGDAPLAGARLAFGKHVLPRFHVAKADVILSLDADFLSCGPGHLRYVREFSSRRSGDPAKMNRLYVAESMFSTTGASADHHLPLRSADVEGLARAIAAKLGVPGVTGEPPAFAARWADAVARDLRFVDGKEEKGKRPPGSTLVIAGNGQPPAVHALAHAMNERLGNRGQTVVYTAPVSVASTTPGPSIERLAQAMKDGKVKILFVLGGNPVFTAPAELDFVKRMDQVPLRVDLGPYFDETSAHCHWHVPESHYLETWSDARAFDGTATIMQPLIAPLYTSRSAHEVLSYLFESSPLTGHELVRAYWRKWWEGRKDRSGTFEAFWKTAVHDGVIKGSAFDPEPVALRADFARALPEAGSPGSGLEIVFRPDPTVFDGRFANNGWLQELPKPLTRLTWDNAAIMSPKTAEKLGLPPVRFGSHGGEHGEAYTAMVTLALDGRTLTLPIWALPGHADDSITVHFGYGRTRAGTVGDKTGFNAYVLRTSDHLWMAAGVTVTKTGRQHLLACTQGHSTMEGRNLVRSATLAEYRKQPNFAQLPDEEHHEEKGTQRRPLTLYEPHDYSKVHKWGMVINLGACVGCGACVAACQAENNIPVVGKDQVSRGREMHWLRVDRYFKGDPLDHPQQLEAVHQPVPCMQCENAPCEQVCPVEATVHSFDGLNDMVYNRCVGTRYCSNNCPYKVRRFNFLQYADFTTPSLKLLHNPEVTVRSRGVMEKCTYCVQRIRAGEIEAQREHRPLVNGQTVSLIRDGEVQTACQAVCPAQAIVFGDLNGPDASGKAGTHSRVAHLRESKLHYSLLAELNTVPRTTYLAALRNPNPELGEQTHGG